MKIELIFKTPDVLDIALDEVSVELLEDEDIATIKSRLSKWIKWDEIVKLEYDTETDEITVWQV